MNITFEDKVVVVTGASSGIGQAIAIEFGKTGASVVVSYNTNQEGARETVCRIESSGGRAIAVQADVTQKEQVDRLIQTALNSYGGQIDILVNNAGDLIERRDIQDMDEDLWNRGIATNLTSVYLCSQAVIPVMKKNGYGRIINISSGAARSGGGRGAGHYAAAKAGVVALTKNLARELAGCGISVNAINPGLITTAYHDKYNTPEGRKSAKQGIPLHREGRPEEVAFAVLFLASKYADYILGEALEINGGDLMD